MPIYQYENRDGEIVSYILPVDQRDGVRGLKRIPSAPFISRGVANPDSSEEGAKRFYRQAEEKGTLKSKKYSKNRIKQIWGW
ncbi:MAG: hypothetical protein EBR82_54555 [Caulobacteraceae bacterium]|nr:hypothetical protein [Caulobacteraceae bacterium]